MDNIRVLVVDDSAFMRKLITDFLEEDADISVVGVARNGKDALEKAKVLKPTVITMDVEMPVINGLDALQLIMKEVPTPVIMLSSTTKEGAENTMMAMQHGAIDFIAKPSGTISLDLHKIKDELIEKVKLASSVSMKNVSIKSYPKVESKSFTPRRQLSTQHMSKQAKKLICIGTSTGGPRALQEVLASIPSTVSAPIVIVQHMPPGFTKSLAVRLNSICSIEVKEAEDGDILKNGCAYIAPGGFHMKITNSREAYAIKLDQIEPPRSGHRPSVDVMLESLLPFPELEKNVVIMTGMGSDGTKGLTDLKRGMHKVNAIAEAQETCIVFGMPKMAIASGNIDTVLPLQEIGPKIMNLLP
ncbi:protein-glutamate methylesterase/protein-glutamine glutaminase [Mangrovibacillus cuniculi]|uniref:Protein-glutamate methylesterase/protein-glutamine glutaminase n=1 Tax=Mangrovibacillus cuniculi TaxID=2593652 RepID=A0A7S8CAE2_9BACI|nr:chemotaxis response regulator protein-glutamate methylesterase [Mangrovibacillus cuniculi]QPC46364.1 chemotaxis response regulator protein-glutamate methylesterase [Mangrovibacillus cuniculi]